MMNFIRNNIVKIMIVLIALIVVVVILAACSKKEAPIDIETGYTEMENRLQNAAIKLTKNNKTLLPTTTEVSKKIKMKTLINKGLITPFHAMEDSNVKCTGYVEVIKKSEDEEDYRYTPYVKCGKYYETKTIGSYIISNEAIVNKGQGLYRVELDTQSANTEQTSAETEKKYSYYFKGEYPNNYLLIGERMYRIMEITEDNNLKVISTAKTEDSYIWDDRFNKDKQDYIGINDFSKSRIKQTLEFLYNNDNQDDGEIFFTNLEKEYIVPHDFCVGKRSLSDTAIYSKSECEVKEELPVGLITLNEYFRVSTSSNCTGVDKQDCNNYNFLYSINPGRQALFMTLTASANDSYSDYQIYYGELVTKKASNSRTLYPVIYLDKNLLYKSGSGTIKDPYIIR